MLTLSLAMQHEKLPEYAGIGISCNNGCEITVVADRVDCGNLADVVSSHSDGDQP